LPGRKTSCSLAKANRDSKHVLKDTVHDAVPAWKSEAEHASPDLLQLEVHRFSAVVPSFAVYPLDIVIADPSITYGYGILIRSENLQTP
jgi:hypothetical protein